MRYECNGLCERFKDTIHIHRARDKMYKKCTHCEYAIRTEAVRCVCCLSKFRTRIISPRNHLEAVRL